MIEWANWIAQDVNHFIGTLIFLACLTNLISWLVPWGRK